MKRRAGHVASTSPAALLRASAAANVDAMGNREQRRWLREHGCTPLDLFLARLAQREQAHS